MIRKFLRNFFIFWRLIVCCCLIIMIITLPFSEASDRALNHSGKSGETGDGSLTKSSLNLTDTPQNNLSKLVKGAGYRMNTSVTDFDDHKIESNVTDSDIAVIAIHGGKIEKGTTELAYALSSHNDYSYFSYLGVKDYDNSNLHITSDEFDEPAAMEMVSKSEKTLSVHGCDGSEEFTYIGGRDTELANKIKASLAKHGFTVSNAPRDLNGKSPNNIVNKNKRGSGVQIELSQGLRAQLLSDDGDLMESYVNAISEAVNTT